MSTWSIGEVGRRAGIRASAIRFYEMAGVLPAPRRVGGRRRYGPEVLRQLTVIELAQRAGFRLREIRTLVSGVGRPAASRRWHALARRKLPEVEALIERAQEMKRLLLLGMECSCVRLEDCRLLVEARRSRKESSLTEPRR